MMKWRRLDLRRMDSRPREGELVALRLVPNNTRARYFDKEYYDIGRFSTSTMDQSSKLWWHGRRGVDDPTRLRKHFDIWWCRMPEFDGY